MNFSLKLTDSQFEALLKLFSANVVPIKPEGYEDKMRQALLLQVYEKLYKKSVFSKLKYTISLTPAEAIATMLFWGGFGLPSSMVFEAHLIQIIINQVHKKYA